MKLASELMLNDLVGRKVRSLTKFSGIEEGDTGVVVVKYGDRTHAGITVEWDNKRMRDGFGRDARFDETQWLEVLS